MNNIRKIIKEFIIELEDDIKDIFKKSAQFSIKENTENVYKKTKDVLLKNKKIASGRLLRSIRKRFIFKSEKFTGLVYSNLNYVEEIIKGTPPGIKLPVSKLKTWILQKKKLGSFSDIKNKKQLTKLTFAIRTKIYKEGVKPFDFYEKAIFNAGGEEFIKDRLRVKFSKSFAARISRLKKNKTINITT